MSAFLFIVTSRPDIYANTQNDMTDLESPRAFPKEILCVLSFYRRFAQFFANLIFFAIAIFSVPSVSSVVSFQTRH
jgi:hypothetical protein